MPSRHLLGVLLLTLLAAGLLGVAGRWAYRQLQIDACLDSGGCWDALRGRCSDVQEDCRTRP